jgi:putative membrane protein
MMKKIIPLCLLLSAAITIQSCEQNQPAKNYNGKTEVDQDGIDFIKRATESGLTEIKASALAQNMSKNPRVISLAKMMIADHTQTGQEITKVAKDKLVDQSENISVEHKKTIDSLTKLTGGFDKAYADMMVKDHEQAVILFEAASKDRIAEVQNVAKSILPKLKMHLNSARDLAASLK